MKYKAMERNSFIIKGLIWTIILVIVVVSVFILYSKKSPIRSAQQIIVVKVKDWMATKGILQCYERDNLNSVWHKIGKEEIAVLGENGLGWGSGLYKFKPRKGEPMVMEGSKRSPAGVFALNISFGQDSRYMKDIKFPYIPLSNKIFCIDDPKSKFYNKIVDVSKVVKDWDSSESMYEYMQKGFYSYGLMIQHNNGSIPGNGSCFFIHVYLDPNQLTVGCTSLSKDSMRIILRWVDVAKHPLLIQLPEELYNKFKMEWDLP